MAEKKEEKAKPAAKAEAKPELPKPAPAKPEQKAEAGPPKAEAKPEKGKPAKEERKVIRELVQNVSFSRALSKGRPLLARRVVDALREHAERVTRKPAFIDPRVNELVWARSRSSPPRSLRVRIEEEEKKAVVAPAEK
jgi:ribosomal protein L31E